jgi:serine/threonine protein kinase
MFGRFELRELVGQGSFGLVYRAWDTVARRVVAVKLPRLGANASPADAQTFLREARNASSLKHENIVPILEANTLAGTAYLITEFVEGHTLADFLKAGLPPLAETARLLAIVLDALHYAHNSEKKVIHRDLKPSNVLIDSRGQPHVTDFGLAQRDGGDGSTTFQVAEPLLVGTLAYMSPEQVLGNAKRVDGRSDVWTAGVVLYQMLTGELPFRGRGRMLDAQIREGDPVPPHGLNDAIPPALEAICLKALAKAPCARYPTAHAMAEDLRLYLAGAKEGATAKYGKRPSSVGEVSARQLVGSHRFWHLLLTLLTLMLALALGLAYWEIRKLRNEARELRDTRAPSQRPAMISPR